MEMNLENPGGLLLVVLSKTKGTLPETDKRLEISS
jgi:hypothetical protein